MAGCKNLTELNISWTDLSSPGLDILCSTAPRGLERICLAGYRETLQGPRTTKLNPIFKIENLLISKKTTEKLKKILDSSVVCRMPTWKV